MSSDIAQTDEDDVLTLFTLEVPDRSTPDEITELVDDAAWSKSYLEDAPGRHIIVIGNPVDGLAFYGLFPDSETATAWADSLQESWWVTELQEAS